MNKRIKKKSFKTNNDPKDTTQKTKAWATRNPQKSKAWETRNPQKSKAWAIRNPQKSRMNSSAPRW